MSLQIIGAGFGRTGTLSLKHALEKLGYVKTYHMFELINDTKRLEHWQALERGEEPNWEQLFEGYSASVDFPGCIFYKQMMERYPDAKVILTLRDPEKWYKSVSDTIYKDMPLIAKIMMGIMGIFNPKMRGMRQVIKFARTTIWKKMFNNRFEDKAYAIDLFNKFNQDVIAHVPADKLLVFEVKDGWEPLCQFLGKPIPNEPFPKVNDTEEFQKRVRSFGK